ncbi:DUF4153 domain-containing protein [Pseudomonas fakonensis]|uniref:DUF4153 domain-containing protein n=1 Tax=Pseudomonas fakonensis TaxID=2842355 RepID=A0ABX8N7T9_9PSED|nr:DUF4153 domain-containing protein [Pseudomonas fakonensis]QXH51821.1 DUF4153 domain-containing protein [Pseudomonas fakonensis]
MPAPSRSLLFYIAIGLFQGLTALGLIALRSHDVWLGLGLPVAICIAVGVAGINLQLLGSLRGLRGAGWLVLALALLVSAVGGRLFNHGDGQGFMQQSWYLAAVGLVYIFAAFILAWPHREGLRPRYQDLFKHAWNNVFIVLLALLLTGLFWSLVWLCSGLFQMVGITLVKDAMSGPVFLWLVLPVVFSLGMRMGRENEKVIGLLRGILLTLCRFLLPLSALIAVVFTLTLPFTGLQPVWDTGYSTALLLTLAGINLFMVNGVFQDGQQGQVYVAPLKRLVEASLLCMPVLVGLAAYASWLRIDQYGLTPYRILAALLVTVMGLHALAALWAVLASRRSWLHTLQVSNPWVALISAVLVLAYYTPLLDPYALSTKSQVQRLLDGRTAVADFDASALYWHLGAPGRAAMADLEAQLEGDQLLDHARREQLRKQLAQLNKPYQPQQRGPNVEWLGPAQPDAQALEQMVTAPGQCNGKGCLLWGVDMDGDGRNEVLLIPRHTYASRLTLFAAEGGWHRVGDYWFDHESTDELVRLVREGQLKPVTPRYSTLKLDGVELDFTPR